MSHELAGPLMQPVEWQLVAGQRLRNGVVVLPYGGYDVATAGIR